MVHTYIPTQYEERPEDEIEVVEDYHSTYTRIKYATPDPKRTDEEYDYDDDYDRYE